MEITQRKVASSEGEKKTQEIKQERDEEGGRKEVLGKQLAE